MKKEYLPFIKRVFTLTQKINKSEGAPTVFISFSGHVEWLEVSIHSLGWIPSSIADFKKTIYVDGSLENYKQNLKDMDEVEQKLLALQNMTKETARLRREKIKNKISEAEESIRMLKNTLEKEEGVNNG